MLYIVATPIGNLQDITFRAIEVLKSVDLIACEDTRHTRILLDHYNIQTPTTSYFQHNRFIKGEYISKLLTQGKDVALVSDAGTPGILDPGYNLINAAIKNNIAITVIPGAAAFVNALVLSGKPTHEFMFVGFLSRRSGARRNRLRELSQLSCTVVFYESCHRILATVEDIQQVFGERRIVVARELTKKFEEIRRASPKDILEHLRKKKPRGEYVVVL